MTPRPQPGNPTPAGVPARSRRRADQPAGFNSGGLDASSSACGRAPAVDGSGGGIVGVNVGKNRDSTDARRRLCRGRAPRRAASPIISWSTCRRRTRRGCATCRRAMRSKRCCACWSRRARRRSATAAAAGQDRPRPVDRQERADIAAVALATGIDGIIVVEHHRGAAAGAAQPGGERSRRAQRPAAVRASTELLARHVPADPGQAAAGRGRRRGERRGRLRQDPRRRLAGAALHGAGFRRAGIARTDQDRASPTLLRRDGFASVAEAVGADHRHETEISIGAGPG